MTKTSGKRLVVGIVALFASCSVMSASKVKMPAAKKVTSPVVTAPVEKAKVLSPMMEANAKDYRLLKKNLGITDEELSRIDALELIVLAYAKMFDGLETRVIKLENHAVAIESEVQALRFDTDKLQAQAKLFDEDLTKLFKWSDKVDGELHNDFQIDGVAYKIKQLRQDVATDLDNHGDAIDKNSKSVKLLWENVNRHSSAINELANVLRSLR